MSGTGQTDNGKTSAARGERVRLARGLSSKILILTVLFVMLAEVLIFVPSIANFRNNWMQDRLGDARIAALSLKAAPDGMVPRELEVEILKNIGAKTLAIRSNDRRQLIALTDMPPPVDTTADMSVMSPPSALTQTFITLLRPEPRVVRVLGLLDNGDQVEIVMEDGPLRQAMLRFSTNILTLSIIISIITAALVYLSLHLLIVRPVRRLTQKMMDFREAPEDTSRVIQPGARRDEIGIAERELATMQGELQAALHQKSRLAALGLAVSKVNHDLRNILATAQLISDRMVLLPDPTVQRFAQKLITTLDRAIDFCTSTLKYGSAAEAPPSRRMVELWPIVEDVYHTLGIDLRDKIGWINAVPRDLEIDVDPEQFVRVLLNLARNSIQALESDGCGDASGDAITIDAIREGRAVVITFRDSGPGIPDRARTVLFEAFRGAVRPGGTGLGLAIAAEIVNAHGGRITLADTPGGAHFTIAIPDRRKT